MKKRSFFVTSISVAALVVGFVAMAANSKTTMAHNFRVRILAPSESSEIYLNKLKGKASCYQTAWVDSATGTVYIGGTNPDGNGSVNYQNASVQYVSWCSRYAWVVSCAYGSQPGWIDYAATYPATGQQLDSVGWYWLGDATTSGGVNRTWGYTQINSSVLDNGDWQPPTSWSYTGYWPVDEDIRPYIQNGQNDFRAGICDTSHTVYVIKDIWIFWYYHITTPAAPSNCTATVGGKCYEIDLTWTDNSDNETYFHIYRDGSWLNAVPANQTYYYDKSITDNSYHSYYVTAYNSYGESSPSNTVQGQALIAPSSAPTGFTASNDKCGQITLNWNSVSGATGYNIYQDGSYLTNHSGTSYVCYITGTHSYYVTAYNTCGESNQSNTAYGTGLTVPSAPTNCSASNDECNQITVSWIDNSGDETGFYIYRDGSYWTTVGAKGTKKEEVRVNTNLPKKTGLLNTGVTKGNAEKGNYSCTNNITGTHNMTDIGTKGKINTNLSTLQKKTELLNTVTIKGNEEKTSYNRIDYITGSHSYYVIAYNTCGNSNQSNTASGTGLTVPTAPSNCQATSLPYPIVITWADNSNNETNFYIYRDGSNIGQTGSNVTNYKDYNVNGHTTYTYYVTAYNTCGESSPSNSSQGEKVEEAKAIPNKFYLSQSIPNPTYSKVTIPFGIPKEVYTVLEIYDLSGKKIASLVNGVSKPGCYAIIWNGTYDNGQKVSPGVYVYRLKAGKFKAIRKLTVLR